ncbi:MAG TPA: ABC transporter permease [Candidatus Dormibacteraeota bacterium]|jgi:peptide/nickel transport system permease protein|nr:ABC transporter permease [Candidatus Dormibacteraeota bacterium]
MIGASPGVETVEAPAGLPVSVSRGYWQQVVVRLVHNRVALVCGVIQVLLILIAVLAQPFVHLVLHQDPYAQDLTDNLVGIGRDGHLLGTDQLGRDVAARLVYGAQVSLLVGYLTVGLQILIGGTLGILAGYYGGVVDALLMRIVDIVLSVPSIFLLILLGSLSPRIGPITLGTTGPVTLAIVIALISWGGVARLVRAETLATKQRDFVLATRSLGAGDARIMFRHLLPNVVSVMVVAASLSVGGVILVEAALDYIGLGIAPPTASWGNMISDAQEYFYHSVSIVVLPGAAIFLTVLAMNLFGNGLRDAIDPRLRRFR